LIEERNVDKKTYEIINVNKVFTDQKIIKGDLSEKGFGRIWFFYPSD
tara:strand:+ start:391 stop:531 length:141 start_codon:yes stop_codon:yes gene_type:complete